MFEKIGKIAEDLTNIEVNTIVRQNITGRKMPSPRHALIKIAKKYRNKLSLMGITISSDEKIRPGSYEYFNLIQQSASDQIKFLENKAKGDGLSEDEEGELLMLHRIKGNSDQLEGIFNSLKLRMGKDESWANNYSHQQVEKLKFGKDSVSLPLTQDEIVLIRKMWDMGVEEIAMQTVVQLDGDVINRIQQKYADKRWEVIHNLHNQNVRISVGYWKDLVNV